MDFSKIWYQQYNFIDYALHLISKYKCVVRVLGVRLIFSFLNQLLVEVQKRR